MIRVRPARPADVPAVVAMVHDLAAYERAPDACHLTTEQLHAALFAGSPALSGLVAVATPEPAGATGGSAAGPAGPSGGSDRPLGFALWFLNFSTWRGVHGIYLEDLYVRPEARGAGVGRALLAALARICVERGYARLDWSVLDWNTPAREAYHAFGAAPMAEWVPYRLDGEALVRLARTAPPGHRSGGRGEA